MGILLQGTQGQVFGPSGANHSQGLVPDPGTVVFSPLRFLREDSSWSTVGIPAQGSVFLSSQIEGTTTNDNAAAGFLGEYVSASISGPGTALTNGSVINFATVVLTGGDWDMRMHMNFSASSLTQTFHSLGFSTISQTRDVTTPGATFFNSNSEGFAGGNATNSEVMGPYRFSTPSTATVYGVVTMNFSAGSCRVWGLMSARRPR